MYSRKPSEKSERSSESLRGTYQDCNNGDRMRDRVRNRMRARVRDRDRLND